jgi:ribosomal protein S18 acetylase RimI-like enzyme
MTDLLGVMESWSAASVTVRAEDGTVTEIELSSIVSGKPVPPRPSARMRISAEQACLLSNASWPAVHVEPLGDWLLRASGGFSARANSVMAVGEPGVPFDEALARVTEFYGKHRLPAWAQVVVGSATGELFVDAGWVTARPGEADSEFQLASVAQASRTVRRLLPDDRARVVVEPALTAAWLAGDDRALAHPADAAAVLEGPEQVGFASVLEDDRVVAKGRVACAGDWAGITDVWVSSDHRRRGFALMVMHAMLEWSAQRGATTAYLQTRGDNAPALALYDRLGFRTHHTYRYLAASSTSGA